MTSSPFKARRVLPAPETSLFSTDNDETSLLFKDDDDDLLKLLSGRHNSATALDDDNNDGLKVDIDLSQRTATPTSTFFNLANTVIGAGVLSLPFCFHALGLVLCIVSWCIIAVVATYALHMLIVCAETTRSRSYEDLVENVFGRYAAIAMQVVIVLYAFGAVVGYVIIVGDLIPGVLAAWTGHDADDVAAGNDGDVWYLKPVAIEGLVCALIILPLAMLKRLDALTFTSVAAIAAIFYFFVLVVVEGALDFGSRTGGSSGQPIRYFNWSLEIFEGLPILAFAAGGHMQAISLYSELAPQHRTLRVWDQIILFVEVGVLSTLYLLVGGISYTRFYPLEEGNILKLMIANDNSVQIQIASLAVSMVVIFSTPIVLWPLRQSLNRLLFRSWPDLYADTSWQTRLRYTLMTACTVGAVYAVAALVGDLKVVFGLTGSVGATIIKFIVPAAVFLKVGGQFYDEKHRRQVLASRDTSIATLRHDRRRGGIFDDNAAEPLASSSSSSSSSLSSVDDDEQTSLLDHVDDSSVSSSQHRRRRRAGGLKRWQIIVSWLVVLIGSFTGLISTITIIIEAANGNV
jgi:amino acid permease